MRQLVIQVPRSCDKKVFDLATTHQGVNLSRVEAACCIRSTHTGYLQAIRRPDRLSAGLSRLAEHQFPSAYRYDNNHNLHIIAEPAAFAQLIDITFNQIRHYGKSDIAITLRLLKAIAQIARHTHCPRDRLALEQQAELILQGSREGLSQPRDRQMVEDLYHQVATTWRT